MYIDNYCSLCHTFKNSPIHFKSRPIHFKSKKNIFLVVWFTKIIFFYTNVTRGVISCSKIQVMIWISHKFKTLPADVDDSKANRQTEFHIYSVCKVNFLGLLVILNLFRSYSTFLGAITEMFFRTFICY